MYQLRDYQQECIDTIAGLNNGNYLVQMATGLGKTVTFSQIPRQGRMLILSHREELVFQPKKYFDCSYGVEQSKYTSNGEEVISASVQSMVKRLDKFKPDYFDIIVTDEAHHAISKIYRKIYNHFKPRLHIGFTATPSRGDGRGLRDVYKKIIFKRDLSWGIKNGYLSPIKCLRANINYNLSQVHTRLGDYSPKELDQAVNIEGANKAVAQAYYDKAKGQTLIFAVNVSHAEAIAQHINGAVVVTGKTKNRDEIIKKFTNREIPVIVNCEVFTEGTDIPLVETIIIARPTKSTALYTQMVGRGVRLSESKEYLTLIDCVGVSERIKPCTAVSLLGYNESEISSAKAEALEGDLFELPEIIDNIFKNDVESAVASYKEINIWAKESEIDLRSIKFIKLPDGSLCLALPETEEMSKQNILIPKADEMGNVTFEGGYMPIQQAIDNTLEFLEEFCLDTRAIWDKRIARRWTNNPISAKQAKFIETLCRNKGLDIPENLYKYNKGEAGSIINWVNNS